MPAFARFASRPAALLSLLVAVGGAGCSFSHAAENPPPKPSAAPVLLSPQEIEAARIVTEPVDLQGTDDVVTTAGRVSFDDLRVSHVFPAVSGRIVRIDAQLGAKVKKGDTLATIESPDIGIASSDFGKAQADLVAAEHDWARQQKLWETRATSQAQLEQSEDNYRKAKAELERAKAKAYLLRAGGADAVSQTFALRAGIDGEVIARMANPGVEVQGQYGGGTAPELFTIGSLDEVWLLTDVFEMDMARVKLGTPVSARVVAFPDKEFKGTVDWVSGSLDPITRTAKVRITLKNDDAEHLLKPEMWATVDLHVDARKALAVPRGAILRLGETPVVFVQAGAEPDGRVRFERRPVKVDEGESQRWVPVMRGLDKGERVVTSGGILLDRQG
jgi:cobalt-zinc-cadmium efflux system membrane fusion protein